MTQAKPELNQDEEYTANMEEAIVLYKIINKHTDIQIDT